jgi:thymidine kinase
LAKLYFRYGTMNASKSLQVLTVAHNYKEQGKKALLFVPEIADRDGKGVIASRLGIKEPAIIINDTTNMIEIVEQEQPDCVLVDEAQFLTYFHVSQLAHIVDEFSVPVICYGLLKDYRAEFFEGSKYLVLYADQIEEIKTICVHPFCIKKATMILKVENGEPIYTGEQIEIGDAQYRSVCRYHYFNPDEFILNDSLREVINGKGELSE